MDNNFIASNKNKEPLTTSFCLIIPMFNEENNVNQCVKSLCKFLDGLEIKCELLVVDDGSNDNTAAALSILKKDHSNLNVETHTVNKGYGVANRTGAFYALSRGYKYVLYMDSDLTQDPKYIYDFIKLMYKDIDFIKATRYSNGGGTDGVPFQRKITSLCGNFIAKLFMRLPITDYTNGFRAIKTKLLQDIDFEENNFAYLIEEIKKVSKYSKTFAEVPYTLTVREDSHSKSKFIYSTSVYFSYLKWLFKE